MPNERIVYTYDMHLDDKRISVSLATVGVAVPNFVLAVFLIILFSFVVPLFRTGGWDSPSDWVLPTVTLALAPISNVTEADVRETYAVRVHDGRIVRVDEYRTKEEAIEAVQPQ